MHIVLTVNAAWNAWNFRRGLLRALIAEGNRVTILAPRDQTVAELLGLGCEFKHLEMKRSGISPLRDAALLVRMRNVLAHLNPDIVLGYTIKNNIFGAIAARSLSIPFIPNITGLGTTFLGGGLTKRAVQFLYKHTFKKLPIVFFQNPDDLSLFVEEGLVDPEQAHRLPGSGIDLGEFPATDMPAVDNPTVFLMISRLLSDKGVREYIAAAGAVRADHPDTVFQLLGPDGSPNPSAVPMSEIEVAAAQGTIDYLGTTSDVRPFIAAAHCVVLPSYREGAPRALIEAAAMGRPLITADVPGSRSVVENGRSGLLCAVRDASALADSIREFLALPKSEKAKMGACGRKKMTDEFDENLVIDAYHHAIKKLVSVQQGSN